jgi:hypothetical protein
MRVAVIQPSYAPWLGYLYMMRNVDLFIYYDNVQYDKNGWRNRNKIIASGKPKWLTLAIDKSSLGASLQDRDLTKIKLANYQQYAEHRRLLGVYYKNASSIDLLDRLYSPELNQIIGLSESTVKHTECIADILGIQSTRVISSTLGLPPIHPAIQINQSPLERKNFRLLRLLSAVGCTEYVSGVSAQTYLDVDLFRKRGINVIWNPYQGDTHNLSVLHYLLTEGLKAVIGSISI